MDVTGTNSGNLGTATDVCLRTMSKFSTVGCSNFDGRSLSVNGVPATCDTAGTYTQIDGYNYIEITSTGTTLTYASVYWY